MSRPTASETPREEPIQGRVVIMDEAAIRGGELETIREFDMKSSPLTFGSSPDADMCVDDAGGLIAAEEARIWVQRGRLVYHKLTTLSAMATEGVTAGWQFLNDGEEMHIGPYRIIFQRQEVEVLADSVEPIPDRLPQEHGMAIHRAFGLTETDRTPDLKDWDTATAPAEPDQDLAAPLSPAPEPGDTPVQEVDKPASSWAIETTSNGEGFPEAGATLSEQDSQQAANWDIESPGESPWTPPLLEPKSADWLVEQSQPVEGGGQIVQPDSWGGFVTSEAGTGDTPSTTDQPEHEEEEPQQRAWGT